MQTHFPLSSTDSLLCLYFEFRAYITQKKMIIITISHLESFIYSLLQGENMNRTFFHTNALLSLNKTRRLDNTQEHMHSIPTFNNSMCIICIALSNKK